MTRTVGKNPLLKVLSLNTIPVISSFVLGILSAKIISVFLGVPGMALLGSLRNFVSMVKSLATVGIGNAAVKLVAENKQDPKELSAIFSTFLWVYLLISSFLALVLFIFASQISVFLFYTPQYKHFIALFGLFLPFMVLNIFWLAMYNGFEKFKRIVAIQTISNILVFGLTAILIWKQDVYGGLLSMVLAELLMVTVTFYYIHKDYNYLHWGISRAVYKKYVIVITKFSGMAILTAVLAPLTLMLIRNQLIANYTIAEAGIWDGVNRFSGFLMMFISSGLSMYYMPKLAVLKTDREFLTEVMAYFKILVPIVFALLVLMYLLRGLIVDLVFTTEFVKIKSIIIWQLSGDFLRIISLAFGFQILVKAMTRKYFIIEIVFNLSYFVLSIFLMGGNAAGGVVQAYFFANLISLAVILAMFYKMLSGNIMEKRR